MQKMGQNGHRHANFPIMREKANILSYHKGNSKVHCKKCPRLILVENILQPVVVKYVLLAQSGKLVQSGPEF